MPKARCLILIVLKPRSCRSTTYAYVPMSKGHQGHTLYSHDTRQAENRNAPVARNFLFSLTKHRFVGQWFQKKRQNWCEHFFCEIFSSYNWQQNFLLCFNFMLHQVKKSLNWLCMHGLLFFFFVVLFNVSWKAFARAFFHVYIFFFFMPGKDLA